MLEAPPPDTLPKMISTHGGLVGSLEVCTLASHFGLDPLCGDYDGMVWVAGGRGRVFILRGRIHTSVTYGMAYPLSRSAVSQRGWRRCFLSFVSVYVRKR